MFMFVHVRTYNTVNLMSLKRPKDDASYAEWEAYDKEIHYRAWIQPFTYEPKYLSKYKKTNK